jgi:hypothetical protein
MAFLLRLFWFVGIVWFAIAELYYFAIPLAILYLFFYTAYELVVLAILIDAYYFAFFGSPILSLATGCAVFLTDFIKPRLLMYTKDDAYIS